MGVTPGTTALRNFPSEPFGFWFVWEHGFHCLDSNQNSASLFHSHKMPGLNSCWCKVRFEGWNILSDINFLVALQLCTRLVSVSKPPACPTIKKD